MIRAVLIIALVATTSVQTLIDSRRWSEAEARLGSVSAKIRPRFVGLIAQGRGQHGKAAAAFDKALALTPGVPQLHLHASYAHLQLKRYDKALAHARAAEKLSAKAIAQPMLASRALQGLGRDAEAYAVLKRACVDFPKLSRPWLELASLAQRNKLSHEVRAAARQVLARQHDRGAVVALVQLLSADPKGLPLLEELVAAHPRDAELRGRLAHVYAQRRQWFSAARLFEDATVMGGGYAFEAADQYRMAGRYRDALRMNGQVPASDAQLVQRLAIIFEQKNYARIVTMNVKLSDLGSRYRLAYAHYAVGNFATARAQAKALLSTAYREEAEALLRAMPEAEGRQQRPTKP